MTDAPQNPATSARDLPRQPIRLGDLSTRTETEISFVPDAAARRTIARDLDLSDLRKMRLDGRLIPQGRADWRLEATLGATVVQPCVVTLEPVVTRIDEVVVRRYLADMPEPDVAEVEMPEDDTAEPLPATIDLAAIAIEALSLAVPAWPRAEGVDEVDLTVTEPGVAPLEGDAVKPFAGLASLKAQMQDKADTSGEDD